MDLTHVLETLERNLYLPKDLFSCEYDSQSKRFTYGIGYHIINDCSILTCGCCIAESLYHDIRNATNNKEISCPVCKSNEVNIVGPVAPLRTLFRQIESFKLTSIHSPGPHLLLHDNQNIDSDLNNTMIQDGSTNSDFENIETLFPQNEHNMDYNKDEMLFSRDKGKPKTNLLNLFFKVASQINNDTSYKELTNVHSETKIAHMKNNTIDLASNTGNYQKMNRLNDNMEKRPESASVMVSLTNKSNTMITERLSQSSTIDNNNNDINHLTKAFSPKAAPLVSVNFDEKKEYFFTKCFPLYRKRSVFKTHSKFLKTKSKLFINSAISPNCNKFALISKHKWEVYNIPKNSDKMETSLICCGRITGEYGSSFDNLTSLDDNNEGPQLDFVNKDVKNNEFIFCELSEELLVITDTDNSIRILDLLQSGKLIHFYKSKYPIRCIDIDTGGKIIACGITGKDRKNNSEQALITLHRIGIDEMTSKYEFLLPITIALPYRDPINTIQLSNDGQYVSCSTTMESRFLIISLRNINEPRLIMKSLRSIDTSLESEGITDTKLFPGNSNLMCVTSTAFNSPPIIINTKIEDISNLRSVAQPTLLNKIVELGCKIHKSEISPRNDSIAFLDKNGSVYIMSAPTMIENEKKRIVLVDIVADAYRAHESASMRFSSDGHILYILDRKGVLYVENFAHDLPQNREITRCKEIS